MTRGMSYTTRASADGATRVIAGARAAVVSSGEGIGPAELKALKATIGGGDWRHAVEAPAIPAKADPAKANMTVADR